MCSGQGMHDIACCMHWFIVYLPMQNSIDLVVAVNPDAEPDDDEKDGVKSPKTMWPPPE